MAKHFSLLSLLFDGEAHSTMGLRPHFDPKLQGFRIRFVRNRLPMTDGWILQGVFFVVLLQAVREQK
jgi:hypothetical protein